MILLGIEELLELEEAMRDELSDRLTEILTRLNRSDQLEEFLALLGMEHLLTPDPGYQVYKTGKIIVIGESKVNANDLLSVAKQMGLDKSRFEFYLEYEDAKKFEFRKMQWQPSYSAIMVGPMPHSGKAKGDFSSIISAIESTEGYPPVYRMGQDTLKITKSGFRDILEDLIRRKKIG